MTRLYFISILIILTSCDPGYSVVLSNKSTINKEITVVNSRRRHVYDQVQVADTSRIEFYSDKVVKSNVATVKSADERSYSFTLGNGKRALLQHGTGFPDLIQKIVINNTDTILLNKDKRVKIKRRPMHSSVKIII